MGFRWVVGAVATAGLSFALAGCSGGSVELSNAKDVQDALADAGISCENIKTGTNSSDRGGGEWVACDTQNGSYEVSLGEDVATRCQDWQAEAEQVEEAWDTLSPERQAELRRALVEQTFVQGSDFVVRSGEDDGFPTLAPAEDLAEALGGGTVTTLGETCNLTLPSS